MRSSALRQVANRPFHDPRLSRSENKATEMALNGMLRPEIAEEMDISDTQVSSHLYKARVKGFPLARLANKTQRDVISGWDLTVLFAKLRLQYDSVDAVAIITQRTGRCRNNIYARLNYWKRKMTYARRDDKSDVAVYKAHDGHRAYWATETEKDTHMDMTLRGLHARLIALKTGGLKVPDDALERVKREMIQVRDNEGHDE